MVKLNELADNPGARKERTRIGRGIGSGKGKTGGRGVKGQKSRSGVSGIRAYEGGQMPLYMRMPKRGFNKPNKAKYVEINLGRIQTAIEAGKLNGSEPIDGAKLVEAGVIRRALDGVRLLGVGSLSSKVDITVVHATASAKAAVEKAGGSVTIVKPKAADKSAEKAPKSEKKKGK
ncbi:MAG: 50S ribosomal protein L15 [Pseudomonadota bacterium]